MQPFVNTVAITVKVKNEVTTRRLTRQFPMNAGVRVKILRISYSDPSYSTEVSSYKMGYINNANNTTPRNSR